MATKASYTPKQYPKDPKGLPRYTTQELQNISDAIKTLSQMLGGALPIGSFLTANLPTSAKAGTFALVSDGASSLSWHATATGGGTTTYLVKYSGTLWQVIG